ncbi:hypothetical protein RHSIM_Rhsim13G0019500 [Rhododendron simsii]|uniref:TMV resistance protein N n=1 Tax=Rhododendron simsii TaxID=118357 RepID=A0A834G5V1_RHOSS|nr:hypothetical protein RHSIM_Rhsim13G0019500 [Rhododendron simsii]
MIGKFSGFKGSPSKSQSSFFSSWNFRTKRVGSIGLSLSPVLGLSCLKDLKMKNCNLSCLPNGVGNLISLETLDLSGNNLPTLPDSICDLTRLKDLTLKGCNLLHLPSEIGKLVTLEVLSLQGNSLLALSDSLCNLSLLKALNLNYCNVTHLPGGIGMLSSLKFLDLESNNICSLPNSFSDLASLERLFLSNCGRLQSLPDFPVSLNCVNASNCSLLERIPAEFNPQDTLYMCLAGCDMLAENNIVHVLSRKRNLIYTQLMHDLLEQEWSAVWGGRRIYLPGDAVPNWFQYQYTGSKFSLVVPPLVTRRILGWILCIVFRTHNEPTIRSIMTISNTKDWQWWWEQHIADITHVDRDQMLIIYLASDQMEIHLHGGDELAIEIIPEDLKKTEPWLTVKKCGINIIYEDDKDNTRKIVLWIPSSYMPIGRWITLKLAWFKEDHPKDDYLGLSEQVVAYAGGLP